MQGAAGDTKDFAKSATSDAKGEAEKFGDKAQVKYCPLQITL